MAKITLTPQLVKNAICPAGKPKLDLFDTETRGLLLSVSPTGRKTYYLRFQNERGRTRQLRIADGHDVSLAQARTLAEKYRNQIAMGEDPAETKAALRQVPTVSEFIHDQYLPFVKNYKRSWQCDEGLLRNHVEPVWGKRYMDQIAKHDVIALITKQRQTHAPGSCNRLLILLRYLFNLALRWDVPGVKANPTAGFPLLEENNKRERYLSREEAATLYDQLNRSDNPMLRYIIPMLLLTGARRREVLDARWEDFDVQRRLWRIPMTKAGKARHVPLSDGALRLLEQVPRLPGCPWVFANPKTHKPFVSIFYAWNTARTNAGLADVRIHDLRHSFASFLINAGRSLYEVQKILGHTQVKTTQRYSHLAHETLVEAANAAVNSLGAVFAPPALLETNA
ncbi:MAG TPA: site-specific integrase [Noviherbaspirillum sp.]|uniref:site-specific integrase n=1 Tax=Noviherbaspirillum sp. TaxID=1926288 RepID=UPI002B475B12|nr:site-specific integrase [Noviherbaspirillum sp.]HJV84314.1 site-specific integrase [Noviherbaspirillum sp.]